jgi:hypothetical protein
MGKTRINCVTPTLLIVCKAGLKRLPKRADQILPVQVRPFFFVHAHRLLQAAA